MSTDPRTRTRRRVAITGATAITRGGIGREAFWESLITPPADGIRQIEDWDATPYFDSPKDARRTDRFAQFSLAAAQIILEDIGVPDATMTPQRPGS